MFLLFCGEQPFSRKNGRAGMKILLTAQFNIFNSGVVGHIALEIKSMTENGVRTSYFPTYNLKCCSGMEVQFVLCHFTVE